MPFLAKTLEFFEGHLPDIQNSQNWFIPLLCITLKFMTLVLGVVNHAFAYWNSIVIKAKNSDISKFSNLLIDCIASSLLMLMAHSASSRDYLTKKTRNYKKCNVSMLNQIV
mgnify:FL=1